MDPEMSLVMVTFTVPTVDAGLALVRVLVEERLIACGQVGAPITSVYEWDGATQETVECPVTCKTTAAVAERVLAAVHERHSYEVPEILVTPVVGSSPAYAAWVRRQTA
jgi:periplasmic divalent cation tolerance protein